MTIEKDIEQLVTAGCDLLFLPAVEEIYPASYQKKNYPLGELENRLEGFYRPGHFQGVCQVVDRLLDIVKPHHLYLGQKDFQQCMVIRQMLRVTGKEEIGLTIVPTQREPDGLAMSSRNLRLNEEQRKMAPAIFQELSDLKAKLAGGSFPELKNAAVHHLTQKGFEVDYVEIARQDDLSPATDLSVPTVALTAASLGGVRLIDNLILN